ncbi:putative nfx1-type zinc finger-containing protein 1 [Phaeomoniella chlamydospora]|uniref:Putative nfx1-type zinc finger-containing protein 1 n=1 Tax=Phaeomoniella chlamydospora TaxID=158046 RepID=A0A0G2EX15_PHACM|nr:putative nfx1-type zinc finger-containing protein 1 [Phaeomoniella chlamydospora]
MTFSLSTTTQGSTLTTTIKAHQLSTHLLAEKPISCDRPRTASHTTNYLSFEVRPPSAPFDDDGPGNLSVEGPRHDNDHVNIRNIQILPTTDEILAVTRAPYMPRKDLREAHFLESPILRLLDTQFRHLRYDNVEYFRDVCYNAAQRLASEALPYLPDFRAQQDTPSGNRYFLYRDAQLEEMLAHERKGLLIRVSYACPAYLRGRGMYRSGRFKEGMLCALIGVDSEDGNLSVTFFETHLAQSTDSMDSRGGNGLRAAVELSFAHSENYSEILRIARYAQGLSIGRFILVEFPNALYAGFYWCLKRLQEMRSTDIAFRSHIAPGPRASQSTSSRYNYRKPPIGTLKLLPPAYVTRDGFTLDLSHLTKTEVRFPPSALQDLSRPLLMDYLKNKTPLDDGQAAAFADSLSRELAFTQGPPGTGKTYLGVALACTILASRDAQDPKPILVVCLTNHALDSFLGGLLEAGQTAIVRVGRGSRESWAKRHSLRSISKKTKFKDLDMKEKWSASQRVRNITNKLSAMANDLNSTKSTAVLHWHDVRSFLEKHHKDIYEQLKTCLESEMAQGFVFDYWSGGGDLQNLANLKKELQSYTQSTKTTLKDQVQGAEDPLDSRLHNIWSHTHLQSESAGDTNIWQLDLTERKRLLDVWSGQIDREFLVHQLTSLHLDVIQANSNYKSVMQRMDKEVLSKQNIIGLTTTACASNWETLKELDLEVVICEEAAEVLESHSLCTLLPSIEHAIFIGDPLQLRPQIEEPNLSLEQRHGFDYRLDESLFERFMIPKDPWLDVIPTSHLSVQRRMHPEISLITRLTYPHLVDHELTLGNPRPIGIAYRTYWLDHTYPEICPSESIKSYSNQYEVHMVVKLVKYLLHGNGYSMGDIAVLTPYNGQLTALNKAMKSTCSIWLCEKDRIALIDDGLLEERDDDSGSKEDVQMSDMLRLATIDNFQGEEAKVVILSTVRSGGSWDTFCHDLRPNPLAARENFRLIGERSTNLLVLQKDVITVRDQVILPFQKSMAKLAPIYPDALPTYNLCFDLRAEVLISRIRSALIEDTLKVAEFIAPLPDPSLELLRMGALLKENALKECTNGTKSLCQMFGQAFDLAAPCLEAELRLQNLKTLHFLGLVLDEDISTYLPLSTEIEHLVILCKRYPSTAGTFLTAVLEYRTFLSKPKQLRPVPPPVIYTFRNTEVNRKWGEHVLGHLTNCRHKHPYSSETFSDGCPECGKEVEFTEEEAKKYGNRLNEDRFLDWMNHIGEQSKSWTCR